MLKVLFVCEHNSGRSQIAEAYLNTLVSEKFTAESCGLEPGVLNPHVVKSMQEDHIDISKNTTDSVFAFFQEERQYDIVITVCSQEVSEKCPIFPGKTLRLNWPFPDPSQLTGTEEEVLGQLRIIRNMIKEKIQHFIRKYQKKG